MNETLRLIISLSISGSLLALLLFMLKPIWKNKLSKSFQYYIWLAVLARLLLPFSFEGSVMNAIFNGGQASGVTLYEAQQPGIVLQEKEHGYSNAQDVIAAGSDNRSQEENSSASGFLPLIHEFGIYVWLLGFAVSMSVSIISYARFSREMKATSLPAARSESALLESLLSPWHKAKLMRNPYAATPMLIGMIRPVIIIPDESYSEAELSHILRHEIVHLKRFDIVIKWLTMIAASVHWFNPTMYLIRKEMNRAGELSCDEAVISKLTAEEKLQYGNALINAAADNRYAPGVMHAMFNNEKAMLKERLTAIMKYKKRSKMLVIYSIIVLSLVIGTAAALGASVDQRKQHPAEPPAITVSHETHPDPIGNYAILKQNWNGIKYDQPSFYYLAWHHEPALLTGLHRPKPGEQFVIHFGSPAPDKVTVQMAFLTESYEESLLPVVDVPVYEADGSYYFTNPAVPQSDTNTSGRVYSITAAWGKEVCSYVFASDGKFDSLSAEAS